MTINYCDFINGDDTTGDGTFGNPYQKIDQASTGLTGGDEVRCAKSPDDIDLSGTLAFINDSDSITTSVDLTGILAGMDFIYKTGESDNIVEILSLTSSIITLYKPYHGTTETVSSKKLGVTDTGIVDSWGIYQAIQEVFASGTSDLSRLKISGGWNLSSQIQDGKTIFEQTGERGRGYGLEIYLKSYLEIKDLGFLRYWYGFYINESSYNNINIITCNNNRYNIDLNQSNYNNIDDVICNDSIINGIYIYNSNYNTLNGSTCNNNTNNGIYLENSEYNNINDATCNNNPIGILLNSSNYNDINNINCNDNTNNGIWLYDGANYNNITNATCNNNTNNGIYYYNSNYNTLDGINCNNNSADGIELYHSEYNDIIDVTCNNNSADGIYLNGSNNNNLNGIICNNNGAMGIFLKSSNYNDINNINCNDNTYGIWLYDDSNNNDINNAICNDNTYGVVFQFISGNNTINVLTCNNNIVYGIYQTSTYIPNFINNYSGTGNTSGDVRVIAGDYIPYYPLLPIQHFNAAGDNRCYYQSGIVYRNTTEARSNQCLRYEATSDTYYIQQEFKFAAPKNLNQNISFYIKDDVAFNGDVQAALFFMGVNITNWETIPTTTDYVQQTLIAHASDITENSIIELKIKVRGTAGNVYIDDFGV